jgi:hypothetical protein
MIEAKRQPWHGSNAMHYLYHRVITIEFAMERALAPAVDRREPEEELL